MAGAGRKAEVEISDQGGDEFWRAAPKTLRSALSPAPSAFSTTTLLPLPHSPTATPTLTTTTTHSTHCTVFPYCWHCAVHAASPPTLSCKYSLSNNLPSLFCTLSHPPPTTFPSCLPSKLPSQMLNHSSFGLAGQPAQPRRRPHHCRMRNPP